LVIPTSNVVNAQVKQEIARLVGIAKEQGSADIYAGKRQRTRYRAGMPFEARTEPASESTAWFVKMHNISISGFACWSKKPVKEGSRMLVREFPDDKPKIWLPARVRHCSAGIRGYLIGAAFDLSGSGGHNEAAPTCEPKHIR